MVIYLIVSLLRSIKIVIIFKMFKVLDVRCLCVNTKSNKYVKKKKLTLPLMSVSLKPHPNTKFVNGNFLLNYSFGLGNSGTL